jgi:hypothetical protein
MKKLCTITTIKELFYEPVNLHNPSSFGKCKNQRCLLEPFYGEDTLQGYPLPVGGLNDRVPGAEPSYCMRNFKLAAELTHPELDSLRRVHTPAPWGGTKGMYPESNTL